MDTNYYMLCTTQNIRRILVIFIVLILNYFKGGWAGGVQKSGSSDRSFAINFLKVPLLKRWLQKKIYLWKFNITSRLLMF